MLSTHTRGSWRSPGFVGVFLLILRSGPHSRKRIQPMVEAPCCHSLSNNPSLIAKGWRSPLSCSKPRQCVHDASHEVVDDSRFEKKSVDEKGRVQLVHERNIRAACPAALPRSRFPLAAYIIIGRSPPCAAPDSRGLINQAPSYFLIGSLPSCSSTKNFFRFAVVSDLRETRHQLHRRRPPGSRP